MSIFSRKHPDLEKIKRKTEAFKKAEREVTKDSVAAVKDAKESARALADLLEENGITFIMAMAMGGKHGH